MRLCLILFLTAVSAAHAKIKVAIMQAEIYEEDAQLTKEQLTDSNEFYFDVSILDPLNVTSSENLDPYQVVILGDYEANQESFTTAFYSALKSYYHNGGGVVTLGWFSYTLGLLNDEHRSMVSELTPIATQSYSSSNASEITMSLPDHELLLGLEGFSTTATTYEVASRVDENSSIIAKSGQSTLLAAKEETGRSVYIGLLYLPNRSYQFNNNLLRQGNEDLLLERSVAWASGARFPKNMHHCFLSNDKAKCIGDNRFGQLGQANTTPYGSNYQETPARLRPIDLGDFNAVEISAAGGRSCAISSEGTLKCWGHNQNAELGLGDRSPRGNTPGSMGNELTEVKLGGFSVAKLSLGSSHSCAMNTNGELKCWGLNDHGQAGLETREERIGDDISELGDRLPLVNLPSNTTADLITSGANHNCAYLTDKTLRCWGQNSSGQLGIGTTEDVGAEASSMGDQLEKVDLGTSLAIKQLSSTDNSTCALFSNGQAKCWGSNQNGQLGIGDTENRGDDAGELGEALPWVDLGANQIIDSLHCSDASCCAVLIQGTMKCWGANKHGQLGYGDKLSRGGTQSTIGELLPFVPQPRLSSVLSITKLHQSTCARFDDGLRCWGLNNYGQLGYGDDMQRSTDPASTPDLIPPLDL